MADAIAYRVKLAREKAELTQKQAYEKARLTKQGYKTPVPETVSGPFSATAS